MPVWMLLGFAAWTVGLLALTIGVYRWALIIGGRATVGGFSADRPEGADWYKRAMRAHANCVENLPVFAAIVLALQASGAGGPAADILSLLILVGRILQSTVHVCLPQTDKVVSVRFTLFSVQLVCFVALIVIIVRHAGTPW